MKFRRYIAVSVLLAVLPLAWGARHLREQVHQDHLRTQLYEPAPPGMTLVPAGEFWMGSDDADAEPDEKPLRNVFVPAFYIDRYEVTNRRFQEFKKDHRFPPGEDDLPVTFVFKHEAEEFCRWAGRRLPTGAEWEKAARGTDGRVYPWGNDFRPGLANIDRPRLAGTTNRASCVAPLNAPPGKWRGGHFPQGASPYGCQDMAGNVWEWVSDVWPDRNSLGLKTGEARGILRGGASSYSPRQARATYQGFEALDATCHDVGFRCAMEAIPQRE